MVLHLLQVGSGERKERCEIPVIFTTEWIERDQAAPGAKLLN